jgi:TM2 domain-containing membrane protein YozV
MPLLPGISPQTRRKINTSGDFIDVSSNPQSEGPVPQSPPPQRSDKKIPAGICGILLGALGIHKFILGYSTEGGIMLGITLATSVLSCCTGGLTAIGPVAMQIIGLVEGIIYLTKSDDEFVSTYIQNQKGWF